MRHLAVLLIAAFAATPLLAQQSGRGQRPNLPDHWVAFDSLSQALRLTDDQRASARSLHDQIDSIVQRGAAVRNEMRQEMQRNRDREQAQRYFQRLQTMQERVDRLLDDFRASLTEEQRTALDALRRPMVAPQRPRGGRRAGG